MHARKLADSLWHFVAVGCAVTLMSACQPTVEEVVAYHRDGVERVFSRLEALDAPARNAPPVTEDRIDVGNARVKLEGEGANALFIRAEDLAAPANASSDANGATRASTVATCGEALRGGFHGVAKGAELFLTDCGNAEYAFVLRTQVDASAQMIDTHTFASGKYGGDVLLLRLSDGALLGGFSVSAASSDQVSTMADADGNPVDASDRLDSDLSAEAFVDIDEKLRRLVPGVIR